jgi:hypothetical protein
MLYQSFLQQRLLADRGYRSFINEEIGVTNAIYRHTILKACIADIVHTFIGALDVT